MLNFETFPGDAYDPAEFGRNTDGSRRNYERNWEPLNEGDDDGVVTGMPVSPGTEAAYGSKGAGGRLKKIKAMKR
jgi:hypothetical protein